MEISLSSSRHQEMIDITQKVEDIVGKSGVKEGICNVFVTHATAAIVINENYDPNVCTDVLNALNRAIPEKAGYLHDRVDGNAGSHIKAAILGPSETVPVAGGKLRLGTWQSLMMVELDGPRSGRTIHVEVIGK
jgi:secondary thiamine-phosphate synthase enzyme